DDPFATFFSRAFGLGAPSPLFGTPELLLEAPRPRSTVRRAVRTRCEVVAEQGFRLLATETSDVSDMGLLVPSAAGVALGEVVFVSLRLPARVSFIDAEAEVVRVLRGRRHTDHTRSIGLHFTRIDAADRALLLASLRGLPPPIPARPRPKDYAASVAAFATR
ncbi:MAG: PilZ domain-containing protein, partial [Myxococcota bacterium]